MSSIKQLQVQDFIINPTQMNIDSQMSYYDVWGTKAHVLMLNKIGVINDNEISHILKALNDIEVLCTNNEFQIDPQYGAQLTLERMIIEKSGDAGYKCHTARSRNDQVIVTEMLFMREKILDLKKFAIEILYLLLELGKNHITTVMPGYTHMQPAKPTTLGQWCLSYFDSLMRGLTSLQHTYTSYNMNPLGAVESYGTSWDIDRKFTAELLGFEQVWEIPLDVISSRGNIQLAYLSDLSEIAITCRKIAQDLMLFYTFEFQIIDLGDEVAQRTHPITGSSVMAQKKNPDVLELIRATAPQIIGYVGVVANILSSLPMGYNRDSREAKEYIVLAFLKMNAMFDALKKVLKSVTFNENRMQEIVINNYSLTTDLADYIAQTHGIGYRLVYKVIGKVISNLIQEKRPISYIESSEIIAEGKNIGLDLKITQEELQQILNPQLCIEKRVHIGGSNYKRLQNIILQRNQQFKDLKEWVDLQKLNIRKSQEFLNELVNKKLELEHKASNV